VVDHLLEAQLGEVGSLSHEASQLVAVGPQLGQVVDAHHPGQVLGEPAGVHLTLVGGPGLLLVGRDAGHGAEVLEVDHLGREAGEAHAVDAGERHVEVEVAAQHHDVVVAVGIELGHVEGPRPHVGVPPAPLPRATEGPARRER
jgi:hypothetical protein